MISCVERTPGVFELGGRVDVTSVADLRTALSGAVDRCAPLAAVPGATVRFDVAALELVDAAGLGALVAAHRRAGRAGLGFALVSVPEALSRLLFISRLYRVITVERATSAAVPMAAAVRDAAPVRRRRAAGRGAPSPRGTADPLTVDRADPLTVDRFTIDTADTDPFISA